MPTSIASLQTQQPQERHGPSPSAATLTATPSPSPTPTAILFAGTPMSTIGVGGGAVSPGASLELLYEIRHPPAGFHTLTFTPDSAQLLLPYGLSFRPLDMASGQFLPDTALPVRHPPLSLAISRLGGWIALVDLNEVVILETSSWKPQTRLRPSSESIHHVWSSHDKQVLLTVDFENWHTAYDTQTWKKLERFVLPKHWESFGFHPGQHWIVAEDGEGVAHFLNLDGREVGSVPIGTRGEFTLVGQDGSPTGRIILEADDRLILHDSEGQVLGSVLLGRRYTESGVESAAYRFLSADGVRMGQVPYAGHGTIRLRTRTSQLLATVRVDGKLLTISGPEGERIGLLRLGEDADRPGFWVEILQDDATVTDEFMVDRRRLLSVVPSSGTLATVGADGIHCIDLDNREETCFIPLERMQWLNPPKYHPDSLLGVDEQKRVWVMDLREGGVLAVSEPIGMFSVKSSAISPNRAFAVVHVTRSTTRDTFFLILGLPRVTDP